MKLFIEIPLARYKELLRKEIGYDYRRAELLDKDRTYFTPSTSDRIMFELDKKTEPVIEEDDF